ncbi:hypothetical protein GCM10009001_00740 [Virgibacillus siamensis]|uniref:VWFA domain-containing protein n=1 Tax=Virgibacillus siamensis TaxID=480071 RepID=A0ABP3QHN4_9BACI
MYKKMCYIFLIIAVIMMVSGCSSDDKKENETSSEADSKTEQSENNQSKDNIKSEPDDNSTDSNSIPKLEKATQVPNTVDGFIKQTQGKFGGISVYDNEKKISKHFKKLPSLSENASEKELNKYFNYIYSLVARDFPNPQDMVKKWEFASFGNPNLPDSRYHFKKNYNIEIILDASGSMGAIASGGKTRMELAKETINEFLSNVPEKANVSLRVYGHKGSGSQADKKMSCSAIEQVYGFAPYKASKFKKALDEFSPKGWTPIASALKQSRNAFKNLDAKKNTNLIYLVSDGIGTCGGNPVKVAKSLSNSNAKPIINIIGYHSDAKAQKQLQKMAKASDGVYTTVNEQKALAEEFNRAEEVLEAWKEWKEKAMQDVEYSGVENEIDIMEFTNNWYSKTLGQSNSLIAAINVAEDAGLITFDQKMKLQDRAHKLREDLKGMQAQIKKNLNDISAKNIKKKKKSINQKYNKQTKN